MWILNSLLIFVGIYLLLKLITLLDAKSIFIFYLIINFSQQIASIIYLNTGVYVSELGRRTYFVPESAPLFILYVDIFLLFMCYFARRTSTKNLFKEPVKVNNLSRLFCYGVLFITACLAIYTTADLLVSGIPMFVTQITRYNYYEFYSRLPYASTVNNLMGLCMYLLGYTYVHMPKRRLRKMCIFFVILCTILRLLMGNKMSGLINVPLNFLAIVALLSDFKLKNIGSLLKPKYVIVAIVAVISVIALFVGSSILNGTADNISQGIEMLVNRAFGLGNHIWWAAEADQVTGNDFFGHNLGSEIWALLSGKNQFDLNTGIYHLMQKYGDSYIVSVDIIHHIRYAATFITTAVYNWGYFFAIFPIAFTAYATIWFLNSIEAALMRDRFFQMVLLCKIWGTFSTYVVASGTMTEWLNPENYIYFLAYFLLYSYGKKHRFTCNER